MGVDIATWRARIGRFFPRFSQQAIRLSDFPGCAATGYVLPYFGLAMLATRLGIMWLAMPLVFLLLIRSGIEQSPGPTLDINSETTCDSCENKIDGDVSTLVCQFCKQSRVHFQCLVKANPTRCGVQNKNSSDWLYSFLLHSPLNYIFVNRVTLSSETSQVLLVLSAKRKLQQF
jgi:hypothetical protein